MTNYWCVNFDFEECLTHGLKKKLWMMQYQYELDDNNIFQGDRKNSVSANWRRTKDIQVGDWFVAYLPKDKSSTGNTYFAIGCVRKPRRGAKPRSNISTVETYIANKSSHEIASRAADTRRNAFGLRSFLNNHRCEPNLQRLYRLTNGLSPCGEVR